MPDKVTIEITSPLSEDRVRIPCICGLIGQTDYKTTWGQTGMWVEDWPVFEVDDWVAFPIEFDLQGVIYGIAKSRDEALAELKGQFVEEMDKASALSGYQFNVALIEE